MAEPPPTVLVAAQLPPPINGLSTVNALVVESLSENGSPLILDLSPPPGATTVRKYFSRTRSTLKAIRCILSRQVGNNAVLYMPSDGGIGLLANILMALVARTIAVRLYVHHHSFAYLNRRSRLMDALIRLAPKGTCHVVLCEEMGERLERAYGSAWRSSRSRRLVVSNAFLLPAAAPAARVGADRPLTLCHVSNLTVAKGAIVFIDLFKRLRAEGIDVRARIAGPATEPEVKATLKRAQAEHAGYFEWLGPVYGEAKTALLQDCDVFVFPTAYANEAQPLVLLEALAAGLPIATIRRGCIGCDFDDSVGLLADNADLFPQQAFAWLRALAADPERLHAYSSRAVAAASAKRTEAIDQLETLVSELTAS